MPGDASANKYADRLAGRPFNEACGAANALAPDALRGRYNAGLTFALTVGVWVGPSLASLTAYVGRDCLLFVVALAILAAVGARLGRAAHE